MINYRSIIKKIFFSLTTLLIFSFLFTSCASYQAQGLCNLSSDMIITTQSENVHLVSKAFTRLDCKKYLDRDVISKGYQPVQIFIQNNSNKTYHFSPSRVSLASARADEVAQKVHTSTAGRAVSYGTAAVLTTGLFAIPAIVDGIKSSNANKALDNDFACKAAKDQIIYPYSNLNMLLFVPVENFQNTFSITLLDQKTEEAKILITTAK
jgi:hypothetical protein